MRTVAVVTTSRADFGIYLPFLKKVSATPDLKLFLIVSGMHLRPEFGMTVNEVEKLFPIGARIETIVPSDDCVGMAESVGLGVSRFAKLFVKIKPDILIVLGDRYEMLSAALAATPLSIPVAHLCGGAVTEGAMDDSFRHCISKLSHLHFVEAKEYRNRLMRMGENPEHIFITGSPSLDGLQSLSFLSLEEINKKHGVSIKAPYFLVAFHPVTHELVNTESQIFNLLNALDHFDRHIVFSCPNADPSGLFLKEAVLRFCSCRSNTTFKESFGRDSYFALMRGADVMIGNSSSGIMEAPSFFLPVVNIGSRQKGRIRAQNVIDVEYGTNEIVKAVERAISSDFRLKLKDMENPFVHGGASDRILSVLQNCDLHGITKKVFFDCSVGLLS